MDLSPIVREILERRGLVGDALEGFLHPTLDRLAKPEELPGVVRAAEIILDSVVYRRKIVIFGDYDCDGVCATAILSKTLRAIGGDIAEFIPDRQSEGYGMSDRSVARMLKENPGVGLVVTVDNGINSVSQIAGLKRNWLSVVVTDHHLPGDELPDANALVDPKVEAPPHLENLCGAGVAFFLAHRIVAEAKRRGIYSGGTIGGPLLVLAGLATVTDVMPLLGQNRIFVSEARKRFAVSAPIGLRELHARASRTGSDALSAHDFGFVIGPRINAAGRVASAMQALELLMTEDREIVRELARIIDGYNLERKTIEQRMLDEAMVQIVPGAPAQVIDLPNGHPGVAGIVAARLLERIAPAGPVCVQAGSHGSARAPEGLNIRDAFVACADTLERFGGHAAAGGFHVKEGRMDDFRRLLCDYCLTHPATKGAAAEDGVDAWIAPEEATMALADEVQSLEPFGEGNREIVFGIKSVLLTDLRVLGSEGRHLSFTLAASGLRAIHWGGGDQIERLRKESASPHDVVFTLAISDYGERHVELRVLEVR